ncbi:uncharacterized protein G6M90_00g030480 [Metarhizium brunneum]|uniref:Uncharacterized protein n=1 Tax=Metarhizium brunneum TaxID=500148 RepID=A0A7D5UUY4_9HYPO|nr:hypothetical protein G6M90_00g030480 [Metarhizium brunneum]
MRSTTEVEYRSKEFEANPQCLIKEKQNVVTASQKEESVNEEIGVQEGLEIYTQLVHHINEMHLALSNLQVRGPASAFLLLQTLAGALSKAIITQLYDKEQDDKVKKPEKQKTRPCGTSEGSDIESRSLLSDGCNQCVSRQDITYNECAHVGAAECRVHVIKDISMGHDGKQIFVATLGEVFDVSGVSAENRATQLIGSMSDTALQEYFRAQSNQ